MDRERGRQLIAETRDDIHKRLDECRDPVMAADMFGSSFEEFVALCAVPETDAANLRALYEVGCKLAAAGTMMAVHARLSLERIEHGRTDPV